MITILNHLLIKVNPIYHINPKANGEEGAILSVAEIQQYSTINTPISYIVQQIIKP